MRDGGLKEDKPDNPRHAPLPAGTEERRFVVQERGAATLRGIGDDPVWSFHRDSGPRADRSR